MSILVSGGAGYIGSHTCVELLQAGYEIVVADNLDNSSEESLRRVEQITGKPVPFVKAELCNPHEVEALFTNYPGIDAVIHFAGLKAVGESVSKPLEYYANNLVSTLYLLQAMRRHGVKNFVFSSSATVYGDPATVPIREDSPTGGTTNPYGTSKLFQEKILSDICAADPGLNVALLRYFNPIGAHESGLIGEDPNGIPNNLMPYIARVAAGVLPELTIFGGDYPTPDGTCQRDYLHVVDLAVGHLKALEYAENHTGVEAINLGTGNGISVRELVRAFETANDIKLPYVVGPRREGDLPAFWADATKAKELLGWEATHTVEDMCRSAWDFVKKNTK